VDGWRRGALLRTLEEVRDDRHVRARRRGRHRDAIVPLALAFLPLLELLLVRELRLVFPLLASALAPAAREAVAHLFQLVLRERPLELLVQRVEQRAHKLLRVLLLV
jgi:hypothetical protein